MGVFPYILVCPGVAWHLPGKPSLCNDWGPVVRTHFLWESQFTDVSSKSADRLEPHRLLGVFPVCREQTGWVDGRPSLKGRGRLQECYLHLIVGVQLNLVEILEVPPTQVSFAQRPWPERNHWDSLVPLYLFLSVVFMCMCAFTGPKAHPLLLHPCGHLPPPGSHTHYQSPLMVSN